MMLRNYASMTNLSYHEKQIEYNMTNLLNEIKFKFNDENIDLNNPKYKELLNESPFNPKMIGGLAESLNLKDQIVTIDLWKDLANGWCKVEPGSEMDKIAIDTPKGRMIQFNKSATKMLPDGSYDNKTDNPRRCGTEFIFPFGEKLSTAIALLATEDPTAEARFNKIAMQVFQEKIMPEMLNLARIRKGENGSQYEAAAEILAVPFMHSENRSEQPFYHFHFDLLNVARGYDGNFYSLTTDEIGANASALDAIFMSSMKEGLEKEFGFVFEAVKHQDDLENEFLKNSEMKTVSFDLPESVIPTNIQEYRKAREKEMEEELKKSGKRGYEAEELARHATRDDKTDKSPSELRQKWKEDFEQLGWTVDQFKKDLEQAKMQKKLDLMIPPSDEILEDSFIRNHKDVAFTEYQYLAHIHKQLLPYMSSEKAQREATRIFESTCQLSMSREQMEFFKPLLEGTIEEPIEHKTMQLKFMREAKFLHSSTIERDKYISESLLARKDETGFTFEKNEVNNFIVEYESKQKPYAGRAFKFAKGQREAIMMIASEKGAVCNVAGRAGAGKSTLLKAARELYKGHGYNIFGTSTSSTATKGLAESTGMGKDEYHNTTKLVKLLDEGKIKFDNKTILFWDEAGMADSKTFYQIVNHINAAGAKLVLVGEKEQLTPVGAGGLFKILNEEHVTTKVTEINRQVDQWQREMVEDFASGRSHQAIRTLYENGRVDVLKTEKDRLKAIVNDYLNSTETITTGDVQFTIVDSNGEKKTVSLNQATYQGKKTNDDGSEYEFTKTYNNEEMLMMATSSDKKKYYNFKNALQQTLGYEVKEILKVEDTLKREIKPVDFKDKIIMAATNDDIDSINEAVRIELKKKNYLASNEITITGKDKIDRNFSVNDRIIFVKNQQSDDVGKQKLLNSEQGVVTDFIKNSENKITAIQIKMDDGRQTILDVSKKHNIKHAYAASINKAQGQTKTEAFYYVSKNINSLHHAYVACSRHRKNVKMYLSEDMVSKMEKGLAHKEPTAQMKKVAEWVSKEKGVDLPSEILNSYTDTRKWLSDNWKEIGNDQEQALDRFNSIIEAMAQTNYKKTSHDYELLDGKVKNTYESIKASRTQAIQDYKKKSEEKVPEEVLATVAKQNMEKHQAEVEAQKQEISKKIKKKTALSI